MKLDTGFDYPGAALDQVFSMLTDPEFQRLRCAATGALESDVAITEAPSGPTVTCRRKMSTEGLPDFVRKLVGATLDVTDRLQWRPASDDFNRGADVVLTFAGQPTKMTGTLRVHTDDAGTKGVLVADLKAGVPLLGGRIEKATAPFILKAMESEQTVGRQWLSK